MKQKKSSQPNSSPTPTQIQIDDKTGEIRVISTEKSLVELLPTDKIVSGGTHRKIAKWKKAAK